MLFAAIALPTIAIAAGPGNPSPPPSPPSSPPSGSGGTVHGAPGPLAGAGLPFIAVGYGAYWLVRRFAASPTRQRRKHRTRVQQGAPKPSPLKPSHPAARVTLIRNRDGILRACVYARQPPQKPPGPRRVLSGPRRRIALRAWGSSLRKAALPRVTAIMATLRRIARSNSAFAF